MKNKSRFLLFAILHSLYFSQVITAQPQTVASSWFPLHIGNEWSFTSGSGNHGEKIIDTARIWGKYFYGMGSSNGTQVAFWFRCSNDSVYVVKRFMTDTIETPIYAFNANIGDTIFLPPPFGCDYGRAIVLAAKHDTISTPSGTYYDCYHFEHIVGCFDGGIYDTWIAKGVGKVKYREESYFGMLTYSLTSSNIITSVEENYLQGNIPNSYLFNNYPNPFNPQTKILYHLDRNSHVSIRIVDILGKTVASLVNEYQEAGAHQLLWNASGMPSGVYFINYSTNGISVTRKMILQR